MNKKIKRNGISILMVLLLTMSVLLTGTITAFATGEETVTSEKNEETQEAAKPVLYEETEEAPEAVLYDEIDEAPQPELITEKDDNLESALLPVWAWILIILGIATALLIVVSMVMRKGRKY